MNTILQKLDKFKFAFLSSEHMRKHNGVSDNYDQKTLPPAIKLVENTI